MLHHLTYALLLPLLAGSLGSASQNSQAPPQSDTGQANALQATSLQDRMLVSLDSIVESALEYNLSLLIGVTGNRAVETGVQAAESAFDPSLEGSVDYTLTDQTLLHSTDPLERFSGMKTDALASGSIGGTLPLSTSYSASLSSDHANQLLSQLINTNEFPNNVNNTLTLSLTQPLLRGRGRSIATAPVESAKLAAAASRERLARTVEETIALVELAYWRLGLAEAVEVTAQDSYNRALAVLRNRQQMSDLQLIPAAEIITSQQAAAARLTALTDATRQRRDEADQLIFLVYGRSVDAQLRQRGFRIRTEQPPNNPPPMLSFDQVESFDVARRHDVRAAGIDVNQSEVERRVADNGVLPYLDLSGSYSAQVLNTDGVRIWTTNRDGDLTFGGWKVGALFVYPLFNNAARAEAVRAELAVEGAELALATAENSALTELRQAERGILANSERLAQSEESLQYALEQYQAGQQQMQFGLIDSFRLLQIEEDLVTAQVVSIQARYDLALAITSYELATGAIDDKYPVAATIR